MTGLHLAKARRDPGNIIFLGAFVDRSRAEDAVHRHYRSIVPFGDDLDFDFEVVTRSGFRGIPDKPLAPQEVVTMFTDLEGKGDAAWIEES